MRCPYCGTNNDGDSLYCTGCGKRLPVGQSAVTQRPVQAPARRKKDNSNTIFIVIIAVLVFALIACAVVGFIVYIGRTATDAVQVVKSGYLGEYTDISVTELLDNCYGSSQEGTWSSGKSSDRKTVVQVKYGSGGETFVQFEMLDDSRFKVVSMSVDGGMFYEGTERQTALNTDYYEVYTRKHSLNDTALMKFIAKLDGISASSVEYGAAKDYAGDRRRLCEADGNVPADESAAQQMYEAGYDELGLFYDPAWDATEEPVAETEADDTPVIASPTVPRETTPQPTAAPPTQAPAQPVVTSHERVDGYVRLGIGELKIRSGPGTDYPEVGRLQEGTKVEVLETARSGSSSWGRIDLGWVCMDYIEEGDVPSSQTVNMTVQVKYGSGGLNVRGGPGTSYRKIDRLEEGTVVTITTIETINGHKWGYIPSQGWICMDYVETYDDSASSQSGGDKFLGKWGDFIGQRCYLTISTGTSGTYDIELKWSSMATVTTFWRATGTYDVADDCIYYNSCKNWDSISDGNGNFRDDVKYTDGTGKFYFSGGNLYWQDDKEDIGSRCCFELLPNN